MLGGNKLDGRSLGRAVVGASPRCDRQANPGAGRRPTTTDHTTMPDMNRRDVLKRAGKATAGIGALGALGANTASAASGWNGAYVTTRAWYNCEPERWGDHKYWSYLVPYFDKYAPEGTPIHLHIPGWNTPRSEGKDKAALAARKLGAEGYDHETVLWDWPSDCDHWYKPHDFNVAEDIAWWDGYRLATFLRDWHDRGGAPINITTHSLGARVYLSALWHLQKDRFYDDNRTLVKSGHLFVAAVPHEWPTWNPFDTGIWRNTTATWNVYNPNDDAMEWFAGQNDFEPALGATAVDSNACNFTNWSPYRGDDHGWSNYIGTRTDETVHQMTYTPAHRRWLVDHC